MKALTIDPGEDLGWALWEDGELLDAGTEKLWAFVRQLWDAINAITPDEHPWGMVQALVVEDWALYPWELKALAWDKCRTARGIGALEFIARICSLEFVLQPASIKDAAEAGGARELFLSPLHENRHANDAIRHGVYYWQRRRAAESGALGAGATGPDR